jgi:prepilin-type N-terminal cleavage/methylation domain-containing protein
MKKGMTLVEVLMASALIGVLVFLVGGIQRLLATTDRNNQDTRSLDLFDVQQRLDFSVSDKLQRKLALAGDPDLIKCLSDLCTPCEVKNWKPLKWGQIPVNLVRLSAGAEPINDGGAHTLPDWAICIPQITEATYKEDDLKRDTILIYPPHCKARSKAHWRAAAGDTIEFQIDLAVHTNSGRVARELRYFLPRAELVGAFCPYGVADCPNHIRNAYGDGRCSTQRVSCQLLQPSFMLSAELDTSNVKCGDPLTGEAAESSSATLNSTPDPALDAALVKKLEEQFRLELENIQKNLGEP